MSKRGRTVSEQGKTVSEQGVTVSKEGAAVSKNDPILEATMAPTKRGLDTSIRISLEKKAGETLLTQRIEASEARAAVDGMEILIVECAKTVGLNTMELMRLMTIDLQTLARKQNIGDFTVHREMEERI